VGSSRRTRRTKGNGDNGDNFAAYMRVGEARVVRTGGLGDSQPHRTRTTTTRQNGLAAPAAHATTAGFASPPARQTQTSRQTPTPGLAAPHPGRTPGPYSDRPGRELRDSSPPCRRERWSRHLPDEMTRARPAPASRVHPHATRAGRAAAHRTGLPAIPVLTPYRRHKSRPGGHPRPPQIPGGRGCGPRCLIASSPGLNTRLAGIRTASALQRKCAASFRASRVGLTGFRRGPDQPGALSS